MDINQKGIITLIRSAISGEKYALDDDFDLETAFNIGKKHQIIPLIYFGAINCGIPEQNTVMQKMFMLTCQYVALDEQHNFLIDKLFAAFEENGIDYMPLKGTNIKKLYPQTVMRSMGDADILIKFEQYEKIKTVMLQLGYTEGNVTSHELKWYGPNFLIELHRLLIPAYSKDFNEYFGDGWRLAKRNECQSRYSMSPEDELIYIFTHFAKHYRDTGVGIKHIVDIWVYRNANKNLDEKYIKDELEKLCLYDFYVNVLNTMECWFGDTEFDDKSELISQIIFNSGVFGTHEAMLLSRAVRMSKSTGKNGNVKMLKYIREIFPRYKDMCIRYPFLRKAPVLLPVMWLVRLVDAVLFRRNKIVAKNNNLKAINKNKIDEYQQSLNFVGLDFNFVEE